MQRIILVALILLGWEVSCFSAGSILAPQSSFKQGEIVLPKFDSPQEQVQKIYEWVFKGMLQLNTLHSNRKLERDIFQKLRRYLDLLDSGILVDETSGNKEILYKVPRYHSVHCVIEVFKRFTNERSLDEEFFKFIESISSNEKILNLENTSLFTENISLSDNTSFLVPRNEYKNNVHVVNIGFSVSDINKKLGEEVSNNLIREMGDKLFHIFREHVTIYKHDRTSWVLQGLDPSLTHVPKSTKEEEEKHKIKLENLQKNGTPNQVKEYYEERRKEVCDYLREQNPNHYTYAEYTWSETRSDLGDRNILEYLYEFGWDQLKENLLKGDPKNLDVMLELFARIQIFPHEELGRNLKWPAFKKASNTDKKDALNLYFGPDLRKPLKQRVVVLFDKIQKQNPVPKKEIKKLSEKEVEGRQQLLGISRYVEATMSRLNAFVEHCTPKNSPEDRALLTQKFHETLDMEIARTQEKILLSQITSKSKSAEESEEARGRERYLSEIVLKLWQDMKETCQESLPVADEEKLEFQKFKISKGQEDLFRFWQNYQIVSSEKIGNVHGRELFYSKTGIIQVPTTVANLIANSSFDPSKKGHLHTPQKDFLNFLKQYKELMKSSSPDKFIQTLNKYLENPTKFLKKNNSNKKPLQTLVVDFCRLFYFKQQVSNDDTFTDMAFFVMQAAARFTALNDLKNPSTFSLDIENQNYWNLFRSPDEALKWNKDDPKFFIQNGKGGDEFLVFFKLPNHGDENKEEGDFVLVNIDLKNFYDIDTHIKKLGIKGAKDENYLNIIHTLNEILNGIVKDLWGKTPPSLRTLEDIGQEITKQFKTQLAQKYIHLNPSRTTNNLFLAKIKADLERMSEVLRKDFDKLFQILEKEVKAKSPFKANSLDSVEREIKNLPQNLITGVEWLDLNYFEDIREIRFPSIASVYASFMRVQEKQKKIGKIDLAVSEFIESLRKIESNKKGLSTEEKNLALEALWNKADTKKVFQLPLDCFLVPITTKTNSGERVPSKKLNKIPANTIALGKIATPKKFNEKNILEEFRRAWEETNKAITLEKERGREASVVDAGKGIIPTNDSPLPGLINTSTIESFDKEDVIIEQTFIWALANVLTKGHAENLDLKELKKIRNAAFAYLHSPISTTEPRSLHRFHLNKIIDPEAIILHWAKNISFPWATKDLPDLNKAENIRNGMKLIQYTMLEAYRLWQQRLQDDLATAA